MSSLNLNLIYILICVLLFKDTEKCQVFKHQNKYSIYKSFENSLDHEVILREKVFISLKKAAFELDIEEATYVLEV